MPPALPPPPAHTCSLLFFPLTSPASGSPEMLDTPGPCPGKCLTCCGHGSHVLRTRRESGPTPGQTEGWSAPHGASSRSLSSDLRLVSGSRRGAGLLPGARRFGRGSHYRRKSGPCAPRALEPRTARRSHRELTGWAGTGSPGREGPRAAGPLETRPAGKSGRPGHPVHRPLRKRIWLLHQNSVCGCAWGGKKRPFQEKCAVFCGKTTMMGAG